MTRNKGFSENNQTANPVSWLLTGMALFFTGFLWLTFVLLLLRLGHFNRNASAVCSLFVIPFFLASCSFGAHFFHSASFEWKNYPFWLDEIEQKRSFFILSLPNLLISVLLLGWNLSWITEGIVLLLFILELVVRQYAPSAGELFGHTLRAHAPRNGSVPSAEQLKTPTEPYAETNPAPISTASLPEQTTPFDSDKVIKLCPDEDLYGDDENIEEEAELPPPEDLLVTQNRCLNPDGSQRVEGWFRVPFSRDETVSVCHLAFCPPFNTRPHLQLIQIEGDEVQISPTMIEPFGTRIEIKRTLPRYEIPFEGEEQNGNWIDRSVRICFFADETASPPEQG